MAVRFPPRGFGEDSSETAPDRRWADPIKLGPAWNHHDRKILLGSWQGRVLGDPDTEHLPHGSGDNRHIVTIAGSRAGKSRDVLIPNLRRYPGSVLVIDPKGELANATAVRRREFGDVFVLDPFNIASVEASTPGVFFNPFAALDESSAETAAADAALIADALIVPSGGDAHWTDSAKNLIRGIILHLRSVDPMAATIKGLRRLLTSESDDMVRLLEQMKANTAFDGVVSNTGRGFLAKLERGAPSPEMRSIISTAIEQTWPLDDVARISEGNTFWLSALTARPTTIYLVLPATRLATHSKWLRLVVNLAIAAIERKPVRDLEKGALPVWLMLEEFAALGEMRSIEMAAGFMAGMGCKLWVVLQDLTQLQKHYPKSWETFLGNAGVIQAWSNVDATTTEYLSKLIGQTTILETRYDHVSSRNHEAGDLGERTQFRSVPLLDPAEVTEHFAREKNRLLVLSPGRPPIYMERFRDAVASGQENPQG